MEEVWKNGEAIEKRSNAEQSVQVARWTDVQKKKNQKKSVGTNMMRTRLVQTSKGEKRAGAGGASERYV